MNGFYSVFAPSGKKVADCGSLQDATTLVAMKGDGHYYQFTPFPGDIIDVSFGKQLPTRDIIVNMDGGVGGSWEVKDLSQTKLSEGKENPVII
jgi:hypothetical protein